MKARITKALEALLDESKGASEELISFYEEQLMLTEYANICTLHAYCRKVLTKYYSYAGLSHKFRVLDDIDIKLNANIMNKTFSNSL